MNTTKIIFGVIVILAFSQCQKTGTIEEPVDNKDKVFKELYGKEYLFTITEFENAEVRNTENEKYIIQLSEDGSTIDFKDSYLHGSYVNKAASEESYERFLVDYENKQAIVYNLNESTFAGGNFIIWYENNKFYAQLTIFGSGVPVIYNVKGDVSPID